MALSLMIGAVMFSNRSHRYDPAADDTDNRDWYTRGIVAVNDILFIMSHWVFVYYYLKVAFTVPVYFESMVEPKQAKAKSKRINKILYTCSVCFILFTILLYTLSATAVHEYILVVIFLTIPLVIVSMVLIYSVCRIQEEVRHIGIDNY